MADKKFDLGDYVEVKDRIKLFYELFGQGRLVTGEVRLSTEPDGVPRVMVQGLAYRTPDDPLPGVGWSWMVLPGTSNYTRGSELENVETSAWGRAIGSLGILIDRSIASAQEVNNKAQDAPQRATVPGIIGTDAHPAPEPIRTTDGGLIGVASVGKGKSDFELRQGPDGAAISFRLVQGRSGVKIVATGPLAEAIATLRSSIEGTRVTCWGSVSEETFTPAGATKPVAYPVMTLTRIKTEDGMLPAPEVEEPPDDIELFADRPA